MSATAPAPSCCECRLLAWLRSNAALTTAHLVVACHARHGTGEDACTATAAIDDLALPSQGCGFVLQNRSAATSLTPGRVPCATALDESCVVVTLVACSCGTAFRHAASWFRLSGFMRTNCGPCARPLSSLGGWPTCCMSVACTRCQNVVGHWGCVLKVAHFPVMPIAGVRH